eukprot:1402939-Karenia_brevis.AAC.1
MSACRPLLLALRLLAGLAPGVGMSGVAAWRIRASRALAGELDSPSHSYLHTGHVKHADSEATEIVHHWE